MGLHLGVLEDDRRGRVRSYVREILHRRSERDVALLLVHDRIGDGWCYLRIKQSQWVSVKEYMKTFETSTVPRIVTKAILVKAIANTQKYNIVTIRPTRDKSEENSFLASVLDRDKARELWGLPDDHPGFFVCTCTSQDYMESGSISEEIVMVFAFLELINIGVLTVNIVPRRARG